jgi:radical SAM superfamily enzyme
LEEYTRKVCIFLENLSPKIAVHRLAAVASRWEELIAPAWTREKMRTTQYIDDYLATNNTWQGRNYLDAETDEQVG